MVNKKKSFISMTERVINIWAKISSVIYIIFLLSIGEFSSQIRMWGYILGILFTLIVLILIYFPLFYYAWINKENKKIRVWGQVLTIFLTIFIVLALVYSTGETPKFLEIFGVIIIYAPVYYYSWRK